ncbi:hypothetical protein HK096_010251 [Nowakowskiella sp. JEL0078]|nr:hypothetical protein HK096_010251 [Nowakowskiella sp. JEL0078]
MGKSFEKLEVDHIEFIAKQNLFFTCTAPVAGQHLNISPKGHIDTHTAIPNATQFLYLDFTGSGNETISHLRENGRITIMFCSFKGAPGILRLFGEGRVIMNTEMNNEYKDLLNVHFPASKLDDFEYRAIIEVNIFEVTTSCGFAVPELEFVKQRDTLLKFNLKRKDDLSDYQRNNNSTSLDGLPGLPKFDHFSIGWIKLGLNNLKFRASRWVDWDLSLLSIGIIAGIFVAKTIKT